MARAITGDFAEKVQYYQKIIGLTFGKQLKQYILNYGFLSFGSLEFYGINAVH